MMTVEHGDILDRVKARDSLACGRLMSWAEKGDPRFAEVHRDLAILLGQGKRVGVTGPAGVGKSSLVEGLLVHWRKAGLNLGVVAIDPTSPFSGGALLGDRVRMPSASLDSGVFIRSMGTRGALGGLARATDDVVDVLDAAGSDMVCIETVGAGQNEVEIARSADVTVVVLQPGSGDGVQAMKAGLLEAADIFVVNKSDLSGAERLVGDLSEMLEMRPTSDSQPAILSTVASEGEGVDDLASAIEGWLDDAESTGRLAERRRVAFNLRVQRLVNSWSPQTDWEACGLSERLKERLAKEQEPCSAYEVAQDLLDWTAKAGDSGENS